MLIIFPPKGGGVVPFFPSFSLFKSPAKFIVTPESDFARFTASSAFKILV